jgi:hypothetical protein
MPFTRRRRWPKSGLRRDPPEPASGRAVPPRITLSAQPIRRPKSRQSAAKSEFIARIQIIFCEHHLTIFSSF